MILGTIHYAVKGILITLPDLSINNIKVLILTGLSKFILTINSLFSSGNILPEAGVTTHPIGKYSVNILNIALFRLVFFT